MSRTFGPRRADWIEIEKTSPRAVDAAALAHLEFYDRVYRALCAVLFNFAQSGHPGGSVSSGRFVASLLFDTMEYDIGRPNRDDADLLSYAAGHKALGLYAMLALRDEVVRVGAPDLLPEAVNLRLRFEDLLGFRRNPTHQGPLFQRFGSKPLDGHPTPATPFVKLATGASGVGVGSSLGLAAAAADVFGKDAPRVHLIEGEGGLTPGRVAEAVAFAATASLKNALIHLDWNQSSIDSDAVTREGNVPGDYVQWDPREFFYLHDWNVVEVAEGFDLACIRAAQRAALTFDNAQPTAIVYRTVKGWRYGIEGKKSHGGGHKLCSPAYVTALEDLLGDAAADAPSCEPGCEPDELEQRYWETLEVLRGVLEENTETCQALAGYVRTSAERLDARGRKPRAGAPDVSKLDEMADPTATPAELVLEVGTATPIRSQLGKVLGYLNQASNGAILVGAADLLDSTAISAATKGFPGGFFNFATNAESRTLSVGGICEDGLACVLSGVSSFGHHLGAGASYGAFVAPLGHIPSRLHAIGNQMRQEVEPGPYRPMVMICGHAGLKTGEDGPTHADPQALQLVQENFAPGAAASLTPWDPQEMWPLMAAALRAHPAAIFPFVTRPKEPVLDREALGLAPASAAAKGVYRLRAASGDEPACTVVMQGSAVAYVYVQGVMAALETDGLDVEVLYVASAELFDHLPQEEKDALLPEHRAARTMGITGFTLPTMYRWVRTNLGLTHTLHPFRKGHYLGSGPGPIVLHEAGLDAEGQLAGIRAFLDALSRRPEPSTATC